MSFKSGEVLTVGFGEDGKEGYFKVSFDSSHQVGDPAHVIIEVRQTLSLHENESLKDLRTRAVAAAADQVRALTLSLSG